MSCAWSLCRTIVAVSLILVATTTQLRADDQVLSQFLERLGLVDLQILHLEQGLQSEATHSAKVKIAGQLADLYAAQLVDPTLDRARYDEIQKKVDTLSAGYPSANTPALQVMLLEADFNRAEGHIMKWISNHQLKESRTQASEILRELAPQLSAQHKKLRGESQLLDEEIEKLEEGRDRQLKEKKLDRLWAVTSRAAYFSGWSNYYLGIVQDSPATGTQEFDVARDAFRGLLGIEKDDYSRLTADWLELSSIARARSLTGLGLTELAAGNLNEGEICFELLRTGDVEPSLRDQANRWQLQGLLSAKAWQPADALARKVIEGFSGSATPGKVGFCATLAQAGFQGHAAADTKKSYELGMLAISGLAQIGQTGVIEKLLVEHNVKISDQSPLVLQWLEGKKIYTQAEASKDSRKYQQAVERLAKALSAPDAHKSPETAARCRYNYAWALYRVQQLPRAGDEFGRVAADLEAADATLAAKANWMAFAVYQQLAKERPRYIDTAIAELKRLKRNFPNSQFSGKVDYHIARLQRGARTPAESIAALEKVSSNDPDYLSARYDLCSLLQEVALKADDDQQVEALERLDAAVAVYLKNATSEPPARRLRAHLMVADVAQRQRGKSSLASQHVAAAKALADALPPENASVAEYHYRTMQLAGATGMREQQKQEAAWIAEHAKGSRWELPALVHMAMAADKEVASARGVAFTQAREEALGYYGRLVQLLGSDRDTLVQKKNARVACSKHATYAEALGRNDIAARQLGKLLQAFPKDSGYLRRAGMARFRSGDYERSLVAWRTLLRGIPAGSDAWYEAKYYQIASLLQAGQKEQAQAVARQFELLYPKLGSQAWRTKFKSLFAKVSR